MAKHKEFGNSNFSMHGDGTCSNCHKKIDGIYMVTHNYSMKSRGKENDTITIRCENCINPKDKAWIKYQKDHAKEEKKLITEMNDPLRFIKSIANNYEYETEYDRRIYTHCFYCDANIGDGESHKTDCLHIYAIKTLNEKNNDGKI
jgi:hypothetical protein